jgi:hypothetical protein
VTPQSIGPIQWCRAASGAAVRGCSRVPLISDRLVQAAELPSASPASSLEPSPSAAPRQGHVAGRAASSLAGPVA